MKAGAVGIIFQPLDGRRHVELAPLEIDDAIAALMPAATEPDGDPAVLLRPPWLRIPSVNDLTGLALPQFRAIDLHQLALARRGRVESFKAMASSDSRGHVDGLALGQGHHRFLDIAALAEEASETLGFALRGAAC